MESEKVKEIKKALEFNANEDIYGLPYVDDNDNQNIVDFNDILTLINELEKENEILKGTKDRLTFADRINIVNNAVEKQLIQFAERLKEKLKEKVNADNVDVFVECAKLSDETLKEFMSE